MAEASEYQLALIGNYHLLGIHSVSKMSIFSIPQFIFQTSFEIKIQMSIDYNVSLLFS